MTREKWAAIVAVVGALSLVGCGKKGEPYGLYCEGGVIKGRGSGECIDISPDKPDTHPDTIGRAMLASKYTTPFVVRRDGKSKSKFNLLFDGIIAGTIVVEDGDWITVTLSSSGQTFKLRSDAPGFLI